MKFEIKNNESINHKECMVIGVFEEGKLTPSALKLNTLSQGYLKKFIAEDNFQGKIGETLSLFHVPNVPSERILLVGCGPQDSITETTFHKIIAASTKVLSETPIKKAVSFLSEIDVNQRDTAWKIKQMVEVTENTLYTFDRFKSQKKPISLASLTLSIQDKNEISSCQLALKQGAAITKGVKFTKDLANLPSNLCTPTYMAEQAKSLTKIYKNISVKVLEKSDMEKLGMGAFLAVSKGSVEPPKLVSLEYKGTSKKSPHIALVGKGVTFDTGGISLKSGEGMIGMKYDMCGAATVLGALIAAAELKLPMRLTGLLALTENMPSGTATKPEDIVTTLSGQTVEILNTDAEGRLILSDTLTYCERFKPDAVIDIATLTMAVVIALGHHATGLLSNNENLAKELIAAGLKSHDRAWQLPLWEEYQEQIKSPFADMANVGTGRTGGSITAACFLSRFTKKFHWAHLDVAGTAAMMGGFDRYATGRPVPLLTQFLINRCESSCQK